MLLSQMSMGQQAIMRGLNKQSVSQAQWQQLMSLGLTSGCRIQMVRRAPLGGAVQLRVRGARLCIDNQLAQAIEVEEHA